MSKPDKQRFSEAMDDLGVIYDKDISVAMKRIYWDDLGQFPIDALEAAIKAHRRDSDRGRFFPRPADILARLGGDASHIPPEAAWAIALESLDENRTVIWTAEIERAREAARPIWDIEDKYGARAAFIKAYEAILLATPTPPRYKISVGHDPEQRHDAVARALINGLLTHDQAKHYLPAPAIAADGAAIAGLLTGKVVALPQSGAARERLAALRASLNSRQETSPTLSRPAVIEAKKQEAREYVRKRLQELAS